MFALFLYTLLQYYPKGTPIGERALIGGVTGAVFAIIAGIIAKNREKLRLKEDVANSRQDIAKSNGGKLTITKEDYSNLYEILTNECNPANFLSPYNAEKVRVANEIYSQLSTNCESIPKLIALRDEAINKLGITISAKRIFDKLSSAYDPSQFIGNNYDAQKLSIANDVYERVVNNEDNIIELEKIAKECGIFSIEDSSTIQ